MPLWNIELTLILQLCFLDDLLKLFFLLDASIFTTIYEKKEEQKSALQIFLKDVTEKKIWKFINTIDSVEYFLNTQKIELLKSRSSHKLLSKQNLPSKTYKKSHIRQLELSLPSANLCFILIIALSLFGFELLRVSCSCSNFFSLASN